MNIFLRRFGMAFLALLIVGVCVDTKPLYDQWYEVLRKKNELTSLSLEKQKALNQVQSVANMIKRSTLNHLQPPLLDQIVQAVWLSHCELNSMQTEKGRSENQNVSSSFILKMTLHGEFISFVGLLELLAHYGLPLSLNSYVLNLQGESLEIAVEFTVYPLAFWAGARPNLDVVTPHKKCCNRDPFQDALSVADLISVDRSMHDIMLEQMRYVGYLAQPGKSAGLILLPNGGIFDVYPGSWIGNKNWRVLRVDAAMLTLVDLRKNIIRQLLRE